MDPTEKRKLRMIEKKLEAEIEPWAERVIIPPPPPPEPAPYVVGQCQICTRLVKSSTMYCKNCYWQCEVCKQVFERLKIRRRFYKNSTMCETCYRDEIFRVAVIPPHAL